MKQAPLPNRQPDASRHDPRPEYLRALLASSGLSQREAAARIGVDPRTMRYYLAVEDAQRRAEAPYCVQYALEQLACITYTDKPPTSPTC